MEQKKIYIQSSLFSVGTARFIQERQKEKLVISDDRLSEDEEGGLHHYAGKKCEKFDPLYETETSLFALRVEIDFQTFVYKSKRNDSLL